MGFFDRLAERADGLVITASGIFSEVLDTLVPDVVDFVSDTLHDAHDAVVQAFDAAQNASVGADVHGDYDNVVPLSPEEEEQAAALIRDLFKDN